MGQVASDLEFEVEDVRDGKLVRWRTFPDQQSALSAVGLA